MLRVVRNFFQNPVFLLFTVLGRGHPSSTAPVGLVSFPQNTQKFDTLSIPVFELSERDRAMVLAVRKLNREYRQAKNCSKERKKFDWIYLYWYRESQEATRWTKDTCRHLDWIANEDNSYIATWYEPQRYENILKLDKMHEARMHPWQGEKITPELSRQSKTFRHQDEQESNYPILPSHQTRQRPVEERQWKWSSWSSPSPSSAEWKGSRTRWTSQKWEDYQWFFLQGVPLTGNGDLLVSAGRCKQYTAPRT